MGRRLRRPAFTREFIDRHGKPRNYFRRPGHQQIALPGMPWSPEYMAAYEAALKGRELPKPIGADRTAPGTIDAAVADYYKSAAFSGVRASTQATYRWILERFREEHGDKRIATLERRHIKSLIAKKATTPNAANHLLRMLRMLLDFAVEQGLRTDNPASGIKPLRIEGDGFHTWSDDEIKIFEDRHAIGTRARLAMALLLYTAQRRGDVIRMGRQHVRDGVLSIRQQKTGMKVEIPVHPELAAIIAATPNEHLTFLVTDSGRSFSAAGFGNWFGQVCAAAGLKQCTAHGLRKAASRRLAEAGATPNEIMAFTGHTTLKEVARYTQAASRKEMAENGLRKVITRIANGKPT